MCRAPILAAVSIKRTNAISRIEFASKTNWQYSLGANRRICRPGTRRASSNGNGTLMSLQDSNAPVDKGVLPDSRRTPMRTHAECVQTTDSSIRQRWKRGIALIELLGRDWNHRALGGADPSVPGRGQSERYEGRHPMRQQPAPARVGQLLCIGPTYDGMTFRYQNGATNRRATLLVRLDQSGSEGERGFDAGQGALYRYLEERGPEICPSFDYSSSLYKYKAKGAAYGYGYNLFLGQTSISMERVTDPGDIALFADAAQINDFQAPALPENPLLEEWYYIDDSADYPNVHFRHRRKANVLSCDGHVNGESPVPGSIDARLPNQNVGRLPDALLFVR